MTKNFKLLFTMLLLVLGGANSVWATDEVSLYLSDGTTLLNNYSTLADAVSAAATDATKESRNSHVIVINESHTSGRCSNIPNGVTIKVKSGVEAIVKCSSPAMFFPKDDNGTFTIDGSDGTLIFDANDQNGSFYQSQKSRTATFKNITIKNTKNGQYSDGNEYSVVEGNGGGSVILDNVNFDDIQSHLIGFRTSGFNVTIQNGITVTNSLFNSGTCIGAIWYRQTSGCNITIADNTTRTALASTSLSVNISSLVSPTSYTITGGGATSNFSEAASDNCYFESSSSNVIVYPKVVYNSSTSTWYNSFSAAVSGVANNGVLQINKDITLNTRTTLSTKDISFKVTPYGSKNITITRAYSAAWFVFASEQTNSTMEFDGSGSGSLTIYGNNTSCTGAMFEVTLGSPGSTFKLTDVTIKNANQSGTGIVLTGLSSNIYLKNVTFDNCTTDYGLLCSNNGNLHLDGDVTFTNCTGADIILRSNTARVVADATLSKPSVPYTMRWGDGIDLSGVSISAGKNLVDVTAKTAASSYFRLTSSYPGWYTKVDGTMMKGYKVTDKTYTLSVSSAGMSTLVLPFNAAIPAGVTAYDLTTSKSEVTASPVSSITAHKPVLIVASAGNYTFTGDAAYDYSGSNTGLTNKALVGTYYSIDAEDDNYVLQKQGDEVGFYKLTASSNHVINPFRAYLSGDPNNSTARLSIVFEESDVTGITDVNNKWNAGRSNYYDLSGRRVDQPTKGLYIVNGKKVVVK